MDTEEMKPWQKGQSLEDLQKLTEPFKRAHKPHCYGAFELTKERDVATALEAGRFLWKYRTADNPTGELRPLSSAVEVGAALIYREVGPRPKRVRDFTGEAHIVPVGSIYVSSFAALDHRSGSLLLEDLREKFPRQKIYIETFIEDACSSSAAELQGMAPLWHLVRAGSEIKVVWFPHYKSGGLGWEAPPERLPGPSYDAVELLSLAELDWSCKGTETLEIVRQELREAENSFRQHYSSYNKRKSWTALSLRGFSLDPGFVIKPQEMSRKWKADNQELLENEPQWTEIASRCPETMALALSLAGGEDSIDRLRFMRLAPERGELARHADITDREAGVAPGSIVRLHIPCQTNEQVKGYSWDCLGRMACQHWREGGLYYLDQRKPHRVTNEGLTDRTHLVLDMRINSLVRVLLADSLEAR